MTVYGGFAPATYEAWSLNLLFNTFGTSGIARGMTVTAPGGMAVTVGADSSAGDGVCYLPNGAFLRVDAPVTFSVPANGTGSTRTDAIIAQVDPSGSHTTGLNYVTNWANSFTPGVDYQLVVALVSVGSGVSSISSGNITPTSAVAHIGTTSGSGGSSNSMVASDGVGLTVQDNSSTANLTIVPTGLTTGVGRTMVLQATDVSGIGHYFYFRTDGGVIFPGAITAGAVHAVADSASGATNASYVLIGGPGGTAQRIFTGTSTPSNASNGDIWLKARYLNPFADLFSETD